MRVRGRIWVERGLFALGAGLLACCLWAAGEGCAAQGELARRLESLDEHDRPGLSGGLALATRREARGSGLVGRIEIPRLRLSAMIVEGTTSNALIRGVGHVEPSAFPGERGNVALAGHRDTYFRRLARLERGDLIRLRTPDGQFDYRVSTTMVVGPQRVDLLGRTRRPTLTLVTCYPFHWIGPAPDRFVVRAVSLRSPERGHAKPARRGAARSGGGHLANSHPPAVPAGTVEL